MKQNHLCRRFLLLGICVMCLLCGCAEQEAQKLQIRQAPAEEMPSNIAPVNPLDRVEITLPDRVERVRISDTQEFFQTSTGTAGGIFLLTCDETIFADTENLLSHIQSLVIQVMETVGIVSPEWQMGGSTEHALYEYTMGSGNSEYTAYFLRGNSACYVLWFDGTKISKTTQSDLLQSLRSEDITEELNKVHTEDLMAAINKRMEGKNYRFDVTLPAGVTREDTSEDGAVFLREGAVIGGYKTVHFEEGILPAADENKQMILDRLVKSTSDQVDLTGYKGEILRTDLITAAFRRDDQEYIHYIHYFGQLGTQYDLWFDSSEFNEMERLTIFATASITEISE